MSEKIKILIGYDGSGCADAALDDLQRAGLPREAEAMIFSVTEVWLPPPPPSSYEIIEAAQEAESPYDLQQIYERGSQAIKEAQALATRAAERLRKNFPAWQVGAEAACGSPARELIRKADELEPDLIIVGSHGRTALGRFVMGSVSQKVLTEARCSVRIARGRVETDDAKEAPVRILIAVDGSRNAEGAAREAARRNWTEGSEARVLIVDDETALSFVERMIPPAREELEQINAEEREEARRIVERAAEIVRGNRNLNVTSKVETGDPKRVLVEAAEGWGASSIFVGSHGYGAVKRFLLGSVSAAIAARAHCSVEVIRDGRDN